MVNFKRELRRALKQRPTEAKEVRKAFKQEGKRRLAIGLLIDNGHLLPDSEQEFVKSLASQYQQKGHLSDKQWPYVMEFASRLRIKLNIPTKANTRGGPCKIYAIERESEIKIGISKDPSKRIRGLQTGNASRLSLIWEVDVTSRVKAKNIETRIHREFSEWALNGEWFESTISSSARHMAEAMASTRGNKARWPLGTGPD